MPFVSLALTLLVASALPAEKKTKDQLIGPGDTVTIQALYSEEISKPWRVGASGDLNLPLVGRIRAAGLTVDQLEGELVQRLSEFIHEPQVTAFVSESRSRPVIVTGAVDKPGTLSLDAARTLFEVLVLAGGPKEAGPIVTVTRAAAHGRIPLPAVRSEMDQQYTVAELDLKEVMDGRSTGANLLLEPEDVVAVSQIKQQKLVHVVGEVSKPGAIELVQQSTVSVMQALAAAGGLTRTAAPRKAVILHRNREGVRTEMATLDLKKIMEGSVKDLDLIPGDILVVPSNLLTSYLQAASMSAVTAGMYILARF